MDAKKFFIQVGDKINEVANNEEAIAGKILEVIQELKDDRKGKYL